MSAAHYAQVPLSDLQTTPKETTFPSQRQDEEKGSAPTVKERETPANSLDEVTASPTGIQGMFTRISSVSHKFWLFEFGASLVSIFIFGAILIVLKKHDHKMYVDGLKDDPNKRPGIFPVLAILSAIMRAVMLLPVATAIGQLKWGWFRSERRLVDIEKFDEASRGMLGSLKLIWTLRFRNIAVIGAALTILALPLDAVIQSSVRLQLQRVANDVPYTDRNIGTITNQTKWPRSTSYDSFQLMGSDSKVWPTIEMINGIKFGLEYASGLNFMKADINVACPTGYCKWDKFQSLGIYYQCIDRSDEIQTVPAQGNNPPYQIFNSSNEKFYFQGAKHGNVTYERQVLSAATYTDWPNDTYNGQFTGESLGPLIARTSMMVNIAPWTPLNTTTNLSNQTMAVDCALYWHIDTSEPVMDASINSTLQYNTVNPPFRQDHQTAPGVHVTLYPDDCFVDGKEVVKEHNATFYDENCRHTVYDQSALALENMLTDYDSDTGLGSGLGGEKWLIRSTADGATWNPSNDFTMNFMKLIEPGSKDDTLDNITKMWRWISKYMVMVVRNDESVIAGGAKEQLYTSGVVYRPIFYYDIDWPRLVPPAFVVLCSALFVVLTAFTTRREHLWKRSMLPLLFHGLGDRERAAIGDVSSYINMGDVAQKLHVKLEEHADSKAARFVTQRM